MTGRLVLHGGGKRGGATAEQMGSASCRRVFRLSHVTSAVVIPSGSEESRIINNE